MVFKNTFADKIHPNLADRIGVDKGIIKFIIGIFFANIIRLFRFIPNNDPIMAVMLPYSKQNNKWASFLFPFITMVSFDAITGYLGVWTIITSVTYGGLGLLFMHIYRKKKKVGLKTYFFSGIFGVLIFDFITGVLATPLMFGMSFEQAFLGQIPFTLMHLVTVGIFTLVITPLLDKQLMENPHLDDLYIKNFFLGLTKNILPKL